MNHIIKFTNNSYFFEDLSENFEYLYQIIKNKRWISLYYEGKKFFIFAAKGRLFYISEFYLCLLLSLVAYLGVIGIRKLIKRFKVRKKVINLITKLRGGEPIIDTSEILHYEQEVGDPININYDIKSLFRLTKKERFIKTVVKKCLKQNYIYKIVDPTTLAVIDRMIDFTKKETRSISYDVFILALLIASKPMSGLAFQALINAVPKTKAVILLEMAPPILSIALGVFVGFYTSVNAGFIPLLKSVPLLFSEVSIVFSLLEYARLQYTIDCSKYVLELPQTEMKKLPDPHPNSLPELDSSSGSSSKITMSYTREEPTQHNTYISTSPGSELHYQADVEKLEIKTLDGTIKKTKKLNGDRAIEWVENRKRVEWESEKAKYIPLRYRTRTLADVKRLDSTFDRESTRELIQTIKEEQVQSRLIKESCLDGE